MSENHSPKTSERVVNSSIETAESADEENGNGTHRNGTPVANKMDNDSKKRRLEVTPNATSAGIKKSKFNGSTQQANDNANDSGEEDMNGFVEGINSKKTSTPKNQNGNSKEVILSTEPLETANSSLALMKKNASGTESRAFGTNIGNIIKLVDDMDSSIASPDQAAIYCGENGDREAIVLGKTLISIAESLQSISAKVTTTNETQLGLLNVLGTVVQEHKKMVEVINGMQKKKKATNKYKTKFENFDQPWEKEFLDLMVRMEGTRVPLSTVTRKQVFDEITRCHIEGIWNEPVLTGGVLGKVRNLGSLVRKHLSGIFGFIDEPKKIGVRVAQFLWKKEHFEKNHLPPRIEHKVNGKISTKGTPVNKAEVPEEQFELWQLIMIYVGCRLFVRQPTRNTDVWYDWLESARDNVSHRGLKSVKIATYFKNDWKPIFERDINNDEDWKDLESTETVDDD